MWAAIRRLSLGLFLIALASGVLLLSDSTRRKPGAAKVPRIAIVQHASQSIIDDGVRGMLDGLAEAGFQDGKNISIRRYNAENDTPTASTIAKQVVSGPYDLVLTATTVSLQAVASANQAGKLIHVFALVSDPYAAGVGIGRDNPLDHPRHLVGYGTMQPVAESFRLAHRMFPGLKVVGVVWNPAEVNSLVNTQLARETCRETGTDLLEANADNTSAVHEAVGALIARGAQALWVGGDVTVLSALESVTRQAREAGIPVFSVIPGSVDKGTLFDFGANYHEVGRLAGALASQILRGTDPATLPVESVLPKRLVVNKAALAGLKDPWQAPDDVLRSADLVVDEHGGRQTRVGSGAPARDISPPLGRTFKVGVVYFAPEPGADICMAGLFDGLRDLGFVEGKNLEVRRAHAQGEIANITPVLQNFDNQNLDLIIPMTTPCLTAACGTVKTTPVVFTYVYDPIAAGAGASFTDHNPNVTGVGSFPPVEDTVDMIQRLVPGVKTVGTLYNSSEANSRRVVGVARDLFTRRGIRLEEVSVVNSGELFQAAQALVARKIEAFWITGDNTAIQGFDAIVKVADDARLPIINNDPEIVERGALACVGIGFYQSGYAAARLAARVLLGAAPKDLPMENVAVKTVEVNLVAARKLGMEFPKDLLARADAIIDESGRHEKSAATATTPTIRPPLAKKWRVNLLEYVNVLDVEEGEKGIRAGLREADLVEGRDYEISVRNAQGDMPTLNTLVDAALSDGADLLMTLSTPTLQAAMHRARDVPIVFSFVADAVVAGAGRSNDDHLPNVTGVPSNAAYDQLLDVMRDCLPSARRIGTLFVPAEINSVYNKDQLLRAAQKRGLEFIAVAANTTAEVSDATLSLLSQHVDAICQAGGNLTTAAFVSIAEAARRAGVPVFSFLSGDFHNGATVVIARDFFDGGREAAHLAARVMRGESPAIIPFHPLETTRLLVNLDVARETGLRIPPSVIERASKVIGTPG